MPVPETPIWYLTPTHLAFGKWGGVLLQDIYTVLPSMAIKMIPQAVPGPRGPRAASKGAFSL